MNAASDGLNLAGDIFVVCMILTVGIVCGRMSNKMSQASSKVINQNTVEYLEADISNLLSSSHTGASVKQYVNKYRRKMRVELVTQKSASAGDKPLLISASTDISRISEKGDEYFVSNDAVFECEAHRDTNGNYDTVRFIQSGSQAAGVSTGAGVSAPVDENDYNGARNYLNGLLGFSDTTGWDVITQQIKSDYSDTSAAKTALLYALNNTSATGLVSDNSSLTEISKVVGNKFQSMQDSIDGYVGLQQTLSAGQVLTLDLSNPKVLILKNASTGLTYVWTSENAIGWVNDDNKPSVTISGNSITNESMTDSFYVIAYN